MREGGKRQDEGEATVAALPPFTVRRMREADIPDVMAIERRSFPSPWPESAYRYELRYRKDSLFYVLQLGEEMPPAAGWRDRLRGVLHREPSPPILGYVGLRLRGDDAHISTIAVHPEWRGLGLGEFLLLEALERAFRLGMQRVTLEVRPSNRVAQRLYAKVGFVRTGVRPGYYRDGEDAWLMALAPLDEACAVRLRALRRRLETRLRKEIVKGEVDRV